MGADPLTLAMVASTVVGTASSIKQGNIANARAKEAAAPRGLETHRQLAQLKRDSNERQSLNSADRAANGGDGSIWTALGVTAESLRRGDSNK